MRSVLALAFILMASAAHAVCGPDPTTVCEIETGSYHIELPANHEGAPALMFLHGWGSSGEGSLSMRGMVETALARGYAVIAPNGVPREGRSGRSWNFHPLREHTRDAPAFLAAVRDDAAARFGIDAEAVVLTGFSIGGSMVAYTACATPDAFMAYAPLAGNFWRPHPETCEGPVRMLHVHGWTDGTVPLEGRIFSGLDGGEVDPDADGVFGQGDVFRALQQWRVFNGCTHNARDVSRGDVFWIRSWNDCIGDAEITFALFYGGHSVPPGFTNLVLDWAEEPES